MTRPESENNVPFPTSHALIEALGPIGQEYARPKEAGTKVDLTFVDPMMPASDYNRFLEESAKAKERLKVAAAEGKFDYSLKELLVRYIRHVDPILEYQARVQNPFNENPELDKNLLLVFDHGTLRSLRQRGYDLRDFMAWTWILKAKSAEQMATRLMVLTHPAFTKQNHFKSVPSIPLPLHTSTSKDDCPHFEVIVGLRVGLDATVRQRNERPTSTKRKQRANDQSNKPCQIYHG